jgi:hypothetical protein
MRCAYLTTDEVNTALALEWAAAFGIELFPLAPKDGVPGREYDAVLCDWDFWPVELRQDMLADLSNGPPPCPLAVHGYNLEEDATMVLCNQGVAVYGRLRLATFRRLRLAHRRARSAAHGRRCRRTHPTN